MRKRTSDTKRPCRRLVHGIMEPAADGLGEAQAIAGIAAREQVAWFLPALRWA